MTIPRSNETVSVTAEPYSYIEPNGPPESTDETSPCIELTAMRGTRVVDIQLAIEHGQEVPGVLDGLYAIHVFRQRCDGRYGGYAPGHQASLTNIFLWAHEAGGGIRLLRAEDLDSWKVPPI